MGCAVNLLFLGGTGAAASNRPLTSPPPSPSAPLRFLVNPLLLRTNITKLSLSPFHLPRDHIGGGNNNNNNGNKNNNNNGDNPFEGGEGSGAGAFLLLLLLSSSSVLFVIASAAVARTLSREGALSVWEVRGLSRWTRLLADHSKDEFVPAPDQQPRLPTSVGKLWSQCRGLLSLLLLPEGFPHSVTPDYLDYSLWRAVQGVASQISEVLATQALLYAVGLGKGAIPAAAAMNWVLKDGIGYLSKIMLSKYGRHFDVNPKGWRLFADLLENAAFGLEMLTPAFPNLFVGIGAIAGASRSAAALIQAATRSCFYAGFAAQRNFAEVIAKGEAQGMVSKFIGIMLGIALANCIGSSTPLALASFSVVTWIHMFCNLKSYQCIQLRTLNPYRASLVFSEYLLSGQAPPVRDVNDEEPFFPALSFLRVSDDKAQSVALSPEAGVAAAEIDRRLQLGSKLSAVVRSKEEVVALFNLYGEESYFLTEHGGKFCVVLKEGCSTEDLLKSVFQANYLYWLERNAGIEARSICDDCRPGGRLHISLDYAQREFNHVRNDSSSVGWVTNGLIARPLPTRIQVGEVCSSRAR